MTSAVSASAAASEPAEPAGPSEPSRPEARPEAAGRRRLLLLVLCGVGTVVFGSFGIWASVAAHSLRSTAASANTALTSRAATASVEHAVTSAVNTIFSYDYADVARTRTAAQAVLTGPAVRQYDQLFALVERQAPKEKLDVTTKVTNIGVEFLTGNRARLLVFANQQDTRAGTTQTSYSGAMFAVTATQVRGHWKIENIDTFTTPG
jgi:Mce-associated membrane protein